MPEMQTIPARHGVATFVPAGQTIKIVNTSGSQVVDTWAFALPHPDVKNGDGQEQGQQEAPKKEELPQQNQKEEKKEDEKPANKKNRRKSGMDLPTQEEAEKATKEGLENEDGQQQQQQQQQPKKSSWSSYVPSVPSIGWSSSKSNGAKQGEQQGEQQGETEKQKNSRTWGSYMPSGKGYSNYIPKSASDTVASFASTVGDFDIICKADQN
jgi:site-specific DNA-cytosine methylase